MLCVTGIEKDIRTLSKRLDQHALYPLQEIRLDALARTPTLKNISIDPRKVIVTCRRKKDLGLFKGSEEERLKRLESACSLGVGWIDLEADLSEPSFNKVKRAARASHTRIIRSLHLEADAGTNEIKGALSILTRSPGDAIKLCVHLEDVADLSIFEQAPKDRPAVLVGTGPAGNLSRALYNRIGSAWTYIAADERSSPTPGMLDVATAQILGLPLAKGAPFFVLFGGPSLHRSPGFYVYNRLFRLNEFEGCYLPAITGRIEEAFPVLVRLGLCGASVTIPHKLKAVHLADCLDDDARNSKSVNTFYLRNGTWYGGNTDVAAISRLATKLGCQPGQRALILGTGGFARAGAWALADLGIIVTLLGRSLLEEPGPWEDCLPLRSISTLPFHLLFNATPVGSGQDQNDLLPKELDMKNKIIVDGALSSDPTPLVQRAARSTQRVGSGIDLWVEQGSLQLKLFEVPQASPEELKTLAIESGKVSATPTGKGRPPKAPRKRSKSRARAGRD